MNRIIHIFLSVFLFILAGLDIFAQPQAPLYASKWRVDSLRRNSAGNSLLNNRSLKLFEKGIDHYNAGRFYSALDIFRRLTGLPPSRNSQLSACYLMTMKSHFQVGNISDAMEVGREFLTRFPTSSYRGNVQECFGDIFVKTCRYQSAVRSYLKARAAARSKRMTIRLDQRLKRLANGLMSREEIEDLLAIELDAQSRSILTFMLASTLLAKGKSDTAALTLFRMDLESLPSSFEDSYESLRQQSYQGSREAVMIGVVLPLTGYDETLGRAFLSGIQVAVESLQERLARTIVLEVMDNGGDILRTVKCIQILSSNPNLVAIIGPLSTLNSVTAATAVQSFGIPLLVPMSTQVGLSNVGKNVFQMSTDLHKQGRYAAEYAISSLGLERLAVLTPADRFGKELSDGFVQRADELGAEIVTIEWYSGLPVDLSQQLISLRKIAFQLLTLAPDTTSLNLELDTLDNTFVVSERDFFPETVSSEEGLTPKDSSEIVLSTIDGIYLPIHQGDINYVASQFPAYNLDSQLLGNTNWYDPDELGQEMISPHVNGMIVLADHISFSDQKGERIPESENLRVKDREEYRVAIFGYDIMTFLTGQLGDDPTRVTVLENLSRSKSFRGTGKLFSFTEAPARVNSSSFILEFRNGKFIGVGEVISDSLRAQKVQSP